jgi:hypothetical protein
MSISTVPKAVQISKLSLGANMGPSPLAGKFTLPFGNFRMPFFLPFLGNIPTNQRRKKKSVLSVIDPLTL